MDFVMLHHGTSEVRSPSISPVKHITADLSLALVIRNFHQRRSCQSTTALVGRGKRFRQMRSKAVASTVLIGGSANAAIERASAQLASIANASAASACDVSA